MQCLQADQNVGESVVCVEKLAPTTFVGTGAAQRKGSLNPKLNP